jgi:Tfp pilus assembly protein PilO
VELQITETQKKVKEIQDFSKKTEESKVRVEEVAKNIEAAQKQLPAEISDSQILGFFNGEATSLNLRDSSIVPGSEMVSTYFIAKPYSFKAVGTYLQFMVFFERMATAARIYNVKSLKLVSTNDAKRGRFQMINGEAVIEAFRYNPDFKVDRGFDTTATPVTP